MNTMLRPLVLVALIVGQVACGSAEVEKRSLVSRFTSNPFFLSHFEGHHGQVTSPTRYSFWQNQGEEEPDLNFYYQTSAEVNDGTEIKNFETTPRPAKPRPKHTQVAVEPIFNTLPLFNKSEVFQTHLKVNLSGTDQRKTKTIFNSLPLFTSHTFRPEKTHQAELYVFGSLPHFKRKNSFTSDEENVEHVELYIFRSLPLYDANHKFHPTNAAPILFLKQEDNEEAVRGAFLSNRRRKVLKAVKKKKKKTFDGVADLPLDFSRSGHLLSAFDHFTSGGQP